MWHYISRESILWPRVVSKISKTLFTIVYVCAAYIITGQFVVSAFDMVLFLFIIDFVTLTLSTDIVFVVTGSSLLHFAF